jgi:metal-responsive CopG/Arc/MetJ family transcriptional regulator
MSDDKKARIDVRIMVSLPVGVADELKEVATDEATPVSVLVRRWIIERLKQRRKEERDQ